MSAPTLLAHLNDDPTQPFAFEHDRMVIFDPTISDCARFDVTPAHYGFFIWETGGGCTAWRRDFVLPDGRPCYMLVTAADDPTHEYDRTAGVGFGVYADEADGEQSWVNYQIDASDDPPRMFDVTCEGEEI